MLELFYVGLIKYAKVSISKAHRYTNAWERGREERKKGERESINLIYTVQYLIISSTHHIHFKEIVFSKRIVVSSF